MNHRIFYRWLIPGVCVFMVLMGLAVVAIHVQVLEIRSVKQDRTLLVFHAPQGTSFFTRFIHSVEGCPVEDVYRIDEQGRLIQTETVFASSRTGLPYRAFDGERFIRETDRFRITDMHRIIPSLMLWVDHRYRNSLTWKRKTIDLYRLAGDTLLEIRVRRMRLVAYWKYRDRE